MEYIFSPSAYPTQVSIQYINRTVIKSDHIAAIALPNENNNQLDDKISIGGFYHNKGDGNPSKGKLHFDPRISRSKSMPYLEDKFSEIANMQTCVNCNNNKTIF